MKYFIFALLLFTCSYVNAQDSSKSKPVFYTGGIIVPTNGNGVGNSIAGMAEFGLIIKNYALALDLGRVNLNFQNKDYASNYFWEVRFMPSTPVPAVPGLSAFLVFGVGNYFDTKHYFIDYGTGVLYNVGKKGTLAVAYGNADKSSYLSIGMFHSF